MVMKSLNKNNFPSNSILKVAQKVKDNQMITRLIPLVSLRNRYGEAMELSLVPRTLRNTKKSVKRQEMSMILKYWNLSDLLSKMTKQPLIKQLIISIQFLSFYRILKVMMSLILELSYVIKHEVNRCTAYLHWKRITFTLNRLQPRNIYSMQIMQK